MSNPKEDIKSYKKSDKGCRQRMPKVPKKFWMNEQEM